MSKIYSRPRIHLPKIFDFRIQEHRNKKRQKMIKIIFIMVVAFSTIKIVLDAILPLFDSLCEEKAKAISTIVSNEEATNVMRAHTYDELFSIEKDNEGNIIMIKSNVFPINEIISDVAVRIQNKIDERGREDVKIALGTFSGFKLLAGRGPEITIKISSVGNVETDLRSEFTAQGINQTLHRVYLQVNCEVIILTPYHNISSKISNQVLIAENVIVGKIPSTYYNLNGLNSSNMVDVIE